MTIDLEAIRARRAAIGDGFWYVDAASTHVFSGDHACIAHAGGAPLERGIGEFVANAPEDIDSLLAEIERLRAVVGVCVESLTQEACDQIGRLIREEQDRAFDADDIPLERAMDRVEEQFSHLCRSVQARKGEWP